MDANNQLQITVNGTIRAVFNVLPLGLTAAEAGVMQRMFTLAAVRPLSYRMVGAERSQDVHVYMVDGANPDALAAWQDLSKTRPKPTVFIAETEVQSEWPTIRRPLLLPRVLGALDQVARREADQLKASIAQSARPALSVLVVDDSHPVRTFMETALGRMNVAPEFALSGEEALLMLLKRDFDIVFMDVIMGGIDGYEVCKQIKSRKGRRCKVVMLTSKDRAFDKIKGALAGCDAYLTKPIDHPKLEATFSKLARDVAEMAAHAVPSRTMPLRA